MHPCASLDCSEDEQQSSQSSDAEAASAASSDDESEDESQGGSSSSGGADDSNGDASDADLDASLPPPPGIGHQTSDNHVISSLCVILESILLSDTPCFGWVRSVSTACIIPIVTCREQSQDVNMYSSKTPCALCRPSCICLCQMQRQKQARNDILNPTRE